jgi:hypothetical protein
LEERDLDSDRLSSVVDQYKVTEATAQSFVSNEVLLDAANSVICALILYSVLQSHLTFEKWIISFRGPIQRPKIHMTL